MGTNPSTNWIFFAAISASTTVAALPYEVDYQNIPQGQAQYMISKDITDWANAFKVQMPTISVQDIDKYNTIIDFTEKLIKNSRDIEQEYVDIVNDNFWDLI
ncbi:unnamed protein product [marine sediment metagenome]|uniref:Uncharacterized protein n=1 Tax=marine sediment metagenome TaxID=412755 RepID=X1IJA5_9ZZZZ